MKFFSLSDQDTEHLQSGFIYAALGTVLFSCKGILIKLCYQHGATPELVMTLRMLFAAPFYIAVLFLYLPAEKNKLNSKRLLHITVLGVLGYYLASFLDLTGLLYISASLERIILYTYPVIVVLLSVLFTRKRYTRTTTTFIGVIYTGLAVVFLHEQSNHSANSKELLEGILFVLASAFSFAIYFVGTENVTRIVKPRFYTALAMLSASLAIFVHSALTIDFSTLVTQSKEIYYLCFTIAVFCTVIPSFLVSAGIHRIGAAKAGAVGSIGPLVTLVFAVLFLDESLSVIQIVGFAIVIYGVYSLSRQK